MTSHVVPQARIVPEGGGPAGELERPPEGIARGLLPAPGWLVGGIAGLLVLSIAAFFLTRFLLRKQRARHERRLDSVAPPSSRR